MVAIWHAPFLAFEGPASRVGLLPLDMLASLPSYLIGLSRYQKRVVLVVSDLALLNFSLWLALSVRTGDYYIVPSWQFLALLVTVPAFAVTALFHVGLYRHVTRHFGAQGLKLVAACTGGSALFLGLAAFVTGTEDLPRSVPFLYVVFGTLSLWGVRLLAQRLVVSEGILLPPPAAPWELRNVIIYGATQDGRALMHATRRSRNLVVAGFVDPDPNLWRRYVDGVRVYAPDQLSRIVKTSNIEQVLLATSRSARRERVEAMRCLGNCPVEVLALPAVEEIAAGRVSVSDLRPVQAEDLLGRTPIPADPGLMRAAIEGRSVLVTGAGGSIGSELVRQVLRHAPRRLVMLDVGETNLFSIGQEVERILRADAASGEAGGSPEIVSVLGSISNDPLVRGLLRTHAVQTVYHAAAFKHVPIIEANPVVGVRNNVLGTEVLANAAADCGVERFVFISTDKAVRPTSVMGASKRVAEMLLQARGTEPRGTVFAIVRFGNVIDSSGSVVQQFRRQIADGGPVTVTHPGMVRYFISMPEAAALVIQAGAMAEGGEIFALDMGEPVRIVDLAHMMIGLSGRTVRDTEHPDGEIEIVFTGSRPGEKLVEELHASGRTSPTSHPRIVRIEDSHASAASLATHMDAIRSALDRNDPAKLKRALASAVREPDPALQTAQTLKMV